MKRIKIAESHEVQEAKLHAIQAEGNSLLLTRVQGKVCAIAGKCPHLGLPMKGGKVVDGTIRCPWHGSRFDICTGKNLDWTNSFIGIPMPKWMHSLIALGKKPASVQTFVASEEGGSVFVEVPGA